MYRMSVRASVSNLRLCILARGG